jgi:hypothetical protein
MGRKAESLLRSLTKQKYLLSPFLFKIAQEVPANQARERDQSHLDTNRERQIVTVCI